MIFFPDALLVPVLAACMTTTLHAQCEPDWQPTFGGQAALDGPVWAMTVFDDGTGPALYAGGAFVTAGGSPVNGVARWDGATWTPLGLGMDERVLALRGFEGNLDIHFGEGNLDIHFAPSSRSGCPTSLTSLAQACRSVRADPVDVAPSLGVTWPVRT